MTLLVLFAVAAGAGTALSPCVLPVLPALLSAGASGGRRRPFGVVLGLATTFTITVAGFASVIDGVGLGDGTLRSLAVIALLVFGVVLLAPKLADRIEAPLSRLARFGPRTGGEGFWSGLGVGAALGFVYAPCAGPVLAAVISVGAASGSSLAVAIGYAIGTAAVLLVFCLGGRRVLARVSPAGAAAGARRRDDPDRARDRHAGRPALPDRARRARPGLPRQPDRLARALRADRGAARPAAREVALRRDGARHRRREAEGARRGARLRRRRALVQLPPARSPGPPRPRRADRLLDLHLHQLPAHAAAPAGVGRALPRARPDDRGRPHARVRLRAQGRQRPGRDRAQPAALSRRPGQRLRDLERLGQPVLAGEVPDRRQGPRALRPLRRGRVRRRPRRRSARCSPRPARRRSASGRASRPGTPSRRRRRRPTWASSARRAGRRRPVPAPTPTPAVRPRTRRSRSAGRGRSTTRPPRRCATRRSTRPSRRARSTSC